MESNKKITSYIEMKCFKTEIRVYREYEDRVMSREAAVTLKTPPNEATRGWGFKTRHELKDTGSVVTFEQGWKTLNLFVYKILTRFHPTNIPSATGAGSPEVTRLFPCCTKGKKLTARASSSRLYEKLFHVQNIIQHIPSQNASVCRFRCKPFSATNARARTQTRRSLQTYREYVTVSIG